MPSRERPSVPQRIAGVGAGVHGLVAGCLALTALVVSAALGAHAAEPAPPPPVPAPPVARMGPPLPAQLRTTPAQAAPAPTPATPAEGTAPPPIPQVEVPGIGLPPVDAWVDVGAYWPRRSAERGALAAGVLRRGDTVRILGCTPRCDLPRALAIVEGGAVVPLRHLRKLPMPPDLARATDFDALINGRVIVYRAKVYKEPRTSSKELRKERSGYLVTFVAAPDAPEGWLLRQRGGWMRAKDVKLLKASTFHGVDNPTLPIGFNHHTIHAREIRGGPDAELRKELQARAKKKRGQPVDEEAVAALSTMGRKRYSHFEVDKDRGGRVTLKDGTQLPGWKVRIAWPRRRPDRIGARDLWAHVDLSEQTMVVYRGDTPLRATMVSTGKQGTRTQHGLYGVLSKVRLSTMAGNHPERYLAEGVPWVMHFYQGQALHGAWWHDGFGGERSHGCINMPPLDARWLFETSSPALPKGWRGLLLSSRDERLTLVIDKKIPRGERELRSPPVRVDRRCAEDGRGVKGVDCIFDSFEDEGAGP